MSSFPTGASSSLIVGLVYSLTFFAAAFAYGWVFAAGLGATPVYLGPSLTMTVSCPSGALVGARVALTIPIRRASSFAPFSVLISFRISTSISSKRLLALVLAFPVLTLGPCLRFLRHEVLEQPPGWVQPLKVDLPC